MSNTDGNYPAFFWGNDPNINSKLRDRIAAMMQRSGRGYPKTFGEGLSAIGDALGDVGMARRMIEHDKAMRAEAIAAAAKGETSPDTPIAAAPPTVLPSVPAEASADTPRAPAQPDIQPSPDLAYTPPAQQPSGILAPSMPTGLQRAQSSREQISSLLSGQPMARLPGLPGAAQAAPGALPTAAPEDGGYNMIDAQAGQTPPNVAPRSMRPGVMDAIQRNITNPDMQAQAATMHMREQPPGGRDVSPAGAAGPYGFMAATGRDYGMNTQAEREDLDLSTKGFERFTNDNAARFEQRMGRPPTRQELAVMHQQGAGGGMGLLAGRPVAAANARGNNLPVGDAAGQLAGINRFYGQPPTPIGQPPVPATDMSALSRQTDPRARVANALVNQVPPPAPAPAPAPGPGGAMAGQPTLAAQMAPASLGRPVVPPAPPASPPASPPAAQVAQAPRLPAQGIRKMPPPPPLLEPMSNRERDLTAVIQKYGEYTPPRAVMEAAELKRQREAIDAQNKILYDKAVAAHFTGVGEQEKFDRDTPERQLRMDKLRQEIRKGEAPELKKLEGNEYERGEDGVYRPVRTSDAGSDAIPRVNLNESQSKTLTNHGRALRGHEDLRGKEQLLAEGGAQEALGKVPFFGNKLQESRYKLAKNAADNFVQAFIRQTSGGAYGDVELEREAKSMLPKYGDDAQQIAQKAKQREDFINRMYGGLGAGGQKLSDYYTNKDKAAFMEAQTRIDSEMRQSLARRGERPVIGHPYTKGNKIRIWDGTRWEEY